VRKNERYVRESERERERERGSKRVRKNERYVRKSESERERETERERERESESVRESEREREADSDIPIKSLEENRKSLRLKFNSRPSQTKERQKGFEVKKNTSYCNVKVYQKSNMIFKQLF
jgi:hypothetical protein